MTFYPTYNKIQYIQISLFLLIFWYKNMCYKLILVLVISQREGKHKKKTLCHRIIPTVLFSTHTLNNIIKPF
jgi:hypothetical protein